MSDLLIYETSDPAFADRAIEALRAAGISCYRTGRGARELNATIGRWTDDKVYIYLQQESDAPQANEILISVGAAVEKPLRLPKPWVVFWIVVALVVIAFISVQS